MMFKKLKQALLKLLLIKKLILLNSLSNNLSSDDTIITSCHLVEINSVKKKKAIKFLNDDTIEPY